MKKTFKYISILSLPLLITGFAILKSDIFFKISKSIDIFGKVYKEAALNYVDEIDPSEFMISGIQGMLSSLDPYTIFIDESIQKDIDVITKGKYGGIGASVGIRNGKVTIVDLLEGYPAQRQGIRIGDIILKIDSAAISKKNYNDLGSYLKGKPGKKISIRIDREGESDVLIFEIVLEEIVIKNLTYAGFVPEESNNVYLKLSSFSRSAGDEIKKAIYNLKKEKKIESIVLDLRGNPGGLLDQAIDVSEKFLDKGELIVSVIGRDTSKIVKHFAHEEPIAGKAKLAVLINGGSASASEIVAGAVQDHDRGLIIGSQSFGKGLVQTVIPLPYKNSLKMTTARYYTPSGRCIQKIDYSNGSKVLTSLEEKSKVPFRTDNKREVFSAGGIQPDSSVANYEDGEAVKELLARGIFFRFSTQFFNSNDSLDFTSLSDDELYSQFETYLVDNKIQLQSSVEKLLNELSSVAAEEDYPDEIRNELEVVLDKFSGYFFDEIRQQKAQIATEIRKEIAGRIDGRDGRIKEGLKKDKLFFTAFNLLQEDSEYSRILAFGE